jgi:DNA-binding winged helix-turn-helix (wHTH) protein/Tol biopolymer transport system component
MLRFDDFLLDNKQAKLLRQGKELAIDPKAFELLETFTNQPNVIISREYLLEHLWSGSLVTDNAINKLIANLRKVLEDDPKNPRYIQTISKRGYRFICEVTAHEELDSISKPTAYDKNKYKEHLNTAIIAIVTMIILVIGIFGVQTKSQSDDLNANQYTLELTRAQGAEESARIHPDKLHLYYLKQNTQNAVFQLWIKNIDTSKRQQVNIGDASISQIVAVVAEPNDETTSLLYLDKTSNQCAVYRALLTQEQGLEQASVINLGVNWSETTKLFNCSDKRIKDIDYHPSEKAIYYAAQPQNFWPNHIYKFDLETKTNSLITQDEPIGWGHHSIDISPDGSKLLIMSTNSDYKTQLHVLNLLNKKIVKGMKFDYVVKEAIWYHDSEQILYYAPPPANQIIRSDIAGINATSFTNVSENLSSQMTLFPDGKNIIFSTKKTNLSNRWLVAPEGAADIDNSIVHDTNPTLFHNSQRYLFVSKRSGQKQLYLGHYETNQAEIVTNFYSPVGLNYIAISSDDNTVLLNVGNDIYRIPSSDLNENKPLKSLKQEDLIFTSEYPIIWLDWLTKQDAAITIVKNGIPKLKVVNVLDKSVRQLDGPWSYGMSDSMDPEYIYLVEQQSNALYKTTSLSKSTDKDNNQQALINTQITLPNSFYHVKVDSNMLYYVNNESNREFLNAIPINNSGKSSKYLLNGFDSYDIKNASIMLSDIDSFEGDVHRTKH